MSETSPEAVAEALSAVPDPNDSPAHLLHRAQQLAADLHLAEFGAAGLTQRQLALMAALARSEPASQSHLVAATGIDRSTLAEMVARMVTRGLVLRQRSLRDSRANDVSLTAEGRAALADALPRLARIDAAVLARLPGSRRDTFLDLLARMVQPAPARDEDDAGGERRKRKDKGRKKDRKAKKAKKAAKAARALLEERPSDPDVEHAAGAQQPAAV